MPVLLRLRKRILGDEHERARIEGDGPRTGQMGFLTGERSRQNEACVAAHGDVRTLLGISQREENVVLYLKGTVDPKGRTGEVLTVDPIPLREVGNIFLLRPQIRHHDGRAPAGMNGKTSAKAVESFPIEPQQRRRSPRELIRSRGLQIDGERRRVVAGHPKKFNVGRCPSLAVGRALQDQRVISGEAYVELHFNRSFLPDVAPVLELNGFERDRFPRDRRRKKSGGRRKRSRRKRREGINGRSGRGGAQREKNARERQYEASSGEGWLCVWHGGLLFVGKERPPSNVCS